MSEAIDRIGLNLLFMLPDRGGRETASRELITAIRTIEPGLEIVVYTGATDSLSLSEPWAPGVTMRRPRISLRTAPARIGTELSWLPTRARRDHVQLLHSLGNTAPTRSAMPSVITIHDLHYHRFPEIQRRRTRLGLRLLVPAAARRASRIICPSEATKTDIVEILSMDPDRVHVVPHGPGRAAGVVRAEDELRERYALGEAPIVFCPAVGFSYKNLDRLLVAFAEIAATNDAILVQTGWLAREGEALLGHAAQLGISDRVRFLGWVDSATIEGLYAAATLLVSPSLAEGFGLPVLEAMLRDLPVACSNVSSLPEVAGDAAESFDPTSTTAIAAAVRRLLEDRDRRQELTARGRAQAARFSWAAAAKQTLDVYSCALEEAGSYPSGRSRRRPSSGSKPETSRSPSVR